MLRLRIFATFLLLLFVGSAAAQQSAEPTAEATSEAGAYFVVKSEGIRYTHFPTNGCYYLISGDVTDLYGIPYEDFMVAVRAVKAGEKPSDSPDGYGYSGTDFTVDHSDPSGWLITLDQNPTTYEVWLITTIGGVELSPHILVQLHDCDHNQAVVHFVQVQALPRQTPSNVPLVTTITPPQTNTPFVVEDNQVSYTYSPDLGKPCYYEMAGRVLDMQGKPFTNFIVNIQMIPTDAQPFDDIGYASPGEGYASDGASGWASILPSSPINYQVWLTTKIGSAELSAHIFVPTEDCVHNLARINFVQVRPLS